MHDCLNYLFVGVGVLCQSQEYFTLKATALWWEETEHFMTIRRLLEDRPTYQLFQTHCIILRMLADLVPF